MSDYRLSINIVHSEDRSYITDHRGGRFEIQSFDMRERDFPHGYYEEFVRHKIPRKWDLYLGLVEVPEEAESPATDCSLGDG